MFMMVTENYALSLLGAGLCIPLQQQVSLSKKTDGFTLMMKRVGKFLLHLCDKCINDRIANAILCKHRI